MKNHSDSLCQFEAAEAFDMSSWGVKGFVMEGTESESWSAVKGIWCAEFLFTCVNRARPADDSWKH